MKKLDNCAVISGISYEDDTYVNLENLRAEKIENIPNRKETPAGKNTQHQVILILVVLLILMFLILVVLTSLLYSNYKSISEEMSQMKNNAAAVNERTLELQRNVENLKKSRSCESGWVEFEGHCYFFSDFELNWAKAEKMCLNRGSHLVIINNQAEQSFLQSKTNGRMYWIGLTDLETEGTFKWIDGTRLSYKFWGNGEPNDAGGKEDCAHLHTEGKWNDYFCDKNIYAICEKNLI